MKLRGNYSAEVTYSVGDTVKFSNGLVYQLQKPAPAGTPPTNTHYWSQESQNVTDIVTVVMDALEIESGNNHPLANNLTTTAAGKGLDARQGKALKGLIDDLTTRVSALESAADGDEPAVQGEGGET